MSSETRETKPTVAATYETSPTWRARSEYLYPPVRSWPGYTPRHWGRISSPPTTRWATVEVFDPASTRDGRKLKTWRVLFMAEIME
jgi:hypothetical protein